MNFENYLSFVGCWWKKISCSGNIDCLIPICKEMMLLEFLASGVSAEKKFKATWRKNVVAMQKVRTVAQERVGKTCIKLVGFVLVWNLLGGGIYLFIWLEPFSYPSSISWFIKYVHAMLWNMKIFLIIVFSQSGSLVTAGLFFSVRVIYRPVPFQVHIRTCYGI